MRTTSALAGCAAASRQNRTITTGPFARCSIGLLPGHGVLDRVRRMAPPSYRDWGRKEMLDNGFLSTFAERSTRFAHGLSSCRGGFPTRPYDDPEEYLTGGVCRRRAGLKPAPTSLISERRRSHSEPIRRMPRYDPRRTIIGPHGVVSVIAKKIRQGDS